MQQKRSANMLIAQSGGPSMVINQSLAGAVLTARRHAAIGRIFGAQHGIQGILEEQFIDLKRESVSTLKAVAATPSSALGSVRRKPTPADCEAIFGTLQRLGVGHFFYIGGNDSAETAHIIGRAALKAKFPLRCYHIPKTIDNDLRANDHTPGYGSAARFVALAHQGDDLDNRALGGVKINVVMGRHAGFLTAASALARQRPDDGPHLVYLPERTFDLQRFVEAVKAVYQRLGRCVVAVSEGIMDAGGRPIVAAFLKESDSHGNVQLSGTGALGDLLASEIRARTGIARVRADTFGYLQRSFPGVASETDAREAYAVGVKAVEASLDDAARPGGTVTIRRRPGRRYAVDYVVAPLSAVARHTRHMPKAFINRAGNHVTKAFLAYARPLVGPLPKMGFFQSR